MPFGNFTSRKKYERYVGIDELVQGVPARLGRICIIQPTCHKGALLSMEAPAKPEKETESTSVRATPPSPELCAP